MEFLKKLKNTFILTSLVYIVLGVLMLLNPAGVAGAVCYIVGGALILYGVIKTIGGAANISNIVGKLEMVGGIIVIIAGVFVILNDQLVLSAIPVIMGIVFIVDALDRVRKAAEMKKSNFDKWWIFLLLGLALATLGIILITKPFSAIETVIRVIGAFLIFDGISDIATALGYSKAFKNAAKNATVIEISAEEVDDK